MKEGMDTYIVRPNVLYDTAELSCTRTSCDHCYTRCMTHPDLTPLLQEMRDQLAAHQKTLDMLSAKQSAKSPFRGAHWNILLIIAAITLIAGSIAAYGYFRVLQSIIEQMPT